MRYSQLQKLTDIIVIIKYDEMGTTYKSKEAVCRLLWKKYMLSSTVYLSYEMVTNTLFVSH